MKRFRVAQDLDESIILDVEKLARLKNLEKHVIIGKDMITIKFEDTLNGETHEYILNTRENNFEIKLLIGGHLALTVNPGEEKSSGFPDITPMYLEKQTTYD